MGKFLEATERAAANVERLNRALDSMPSGGESAGIGGGGGGGGSVSSVPPTVFNTTVVVPRETPRMSSSGGGGGGNGGKLLLRGTQVDIEQLAKSLAAKLSGSDLTMRTGSSG